MDAKNLMEKAVEFHGHACPGLAMDNPDVINIDELPKK